MIKSANWITPAKGFGEIAPFFEKKFSLAKKIKSAVLEVTSVGIYKVLLNGEKISKYVLAPGWTEYKERLQYQTYDITDMLKKNNTLRVYLSKGWYLSRNHNWGVQDWMNYSVPEISTIASITLTYEDDSVETILTDDSWKCGKSRTMFCDLYDGVHYDATKKEVANTDVRVCKRSKKNLIPQEGPEIREQEVLHVASIIKTPNGETLLDFGQNMTGYLEFDVDAKSGDKVSFSFGEVLDKDGNLYNDNYRSAKAEYEYICCDGAQTYKPDLTFYGFRYVRVNKYPKKLKAENFRAIVVHSDMKKTGHLASSNPLLNKLFSNVFWGQKSNYLDIPTDCPQRDERFGWTGDTQVFVRTASYNYDVEKFFEKWIGDVAAAQKLYGYVPHTVPAIPLFYQGASSSAWGDVATIVPWQVYLTYGNKALLRKQFPVMKHFVDYIPTISERKNLWYGGFHFGDWLGLDAKPGSYEGSTDKNLIASAFYAYSVSLLIKAGKALNKDMSEYEALYKNIVKAFRKEFPVYETQTACTLALHFDLCKDKKEVAKALADMVVKNGIRLQTGFVGTPYLLHALSENGYTELAYSLLLQEKFPSWLYSVLQGATTIWEHWDGKDENGNFWSRDMNSFNHYAYGAVADWVYGVACGIKPVDDAPGFEKVVIAPQPTDKLESLEASIETRHGLVKSKWYHVEGRVRYEITTPVDATIIIGDKTYNLPQGEYIF